MKGQFAMHKNTHNRQHPIIPAGASHAGLSATALFARNLSLCLCMSASLGLTPTLTGCDGVASPDESAARPQPKPETAAAAPETAESNTGSRSGPSGGRRSTLGKALDFAERTVDDAEQRSQDLADEIDDLND
jgi:hypothetical protein